MAFEGKEFDEEILRKIEFRRTYPELIAQLIERADEKSATLFSYFKELKKNLDLKFFEIKKSIEMLDSLENVSQIPIAGIDGSNVLVKGLGRKYFVVYGISIVLFKKGIESIKKPEIKIFLDIDDFDEILDISPELWATVRMMRGETKAIAEATKILGSGYIFLDGPIIDPPNYDEESYVDYRATVLAQAIKKGFNIIGIVKRYKSKLFVRASNLEPHSDRDAIPLFFSKIRKEGYAGPIYTRPLSLVNDDIVPKFVLYKYLDKLLDLGIDYQVFASYVQANQYARPIKVEFFAEDEEDALSEVKRIVSLISIYTYPKMKIPLPVLLAHKTSLIRKRVALSVIREILTRLVFFSTNDPMLTEAIVDLITTEGE